jgi:hypothetical protein
MKTYTSIEEIYKDLNKGIKVYWSNESYQVFIEDDPCPEKNMFSHNKGKMLRVTCVSNWFGSRITETDILNCFSEEYPCKPQLKKT